MLKSLTLRNFQQHARQELVFSKTVTTITGPNSIGKSGIFRALWWIATNRPQGKGFIRRGKTFARAILSADRSVIRRSRGKHNTYELDGASYKAMGTKVPEPIRSALRLSELNYQRQLSPHLWFHNSPGEVARELNSIIDIGSIDRSLGKIATRVREAKSNRDHTRKSLDDARQAKKELDWVEEMDSDLQVLEKMEVKLSRLRKRRHKLSEILENIARLEEEEIKLTKMIPQGKSLLIISRRIVKTFRRREGLKGLLSRIETQQEALQQTEDEKSEIEDRLSKVKVCPICRSPLT